MDDTFSCNPNFDPARVLLENRLKSLNFAPVAQLRLIDRRFEITLTDPVAMPRSECVYAIAIDGEVVRIGKSQHLQSRLRQYERDLTDCVTGKMKPVSPAHEKEVRFWPLISRLYGPGTIYVARGNRADETALLQRWHPRLNRQRRKKLG